MESRRMKRKHFDVVQNELTEELTKLNGDSAKLSNDMKAAKEDFEQMCKSITDRQAELLTQGLFLEEQHRRVIDILDGGQLGEKDAATEVSEILPTSYTEDIGKLAKDSDQSVRNHRILREVALQEMERVFRQFGAMMQQNLMDMRERGEVIEKERRELSQKLHQFTRYVVEDRQTD